MKNFLLSKSLFPIITIIMALIWSVTGANAAARSFYSPSLLGHPIAFCNSENAECGKSVADNWCTSNGFDEALLFQRQQGSAITSQFIRYADNGKFCTGADCLSFVQIKCYSGN